MTVFDEPVLEFGFEQKAEDPHDGLSIFGPYDLGRTSKPKSINWGLVTTPEGRDLCTEWVRRLQCPIYPGKNRRGVPLDPQLWPIFPGFETAFECSFSTEPTWYKELDEEKLIDLCRNLDSRKRAYDAVEEYLSAIRLTEKKDEEFDVILCVLPDFVRQTCRPHAVIAEGTGLKVSKREQHARASGQTSMFEQYDPSIYCYSDDFRRQLKARCMEHKVPIQLIQQSTITPVAPDEQQLTSPPSDVAWNLSTSIYYKAGGKPWKLGSARPGVCYIGIAFRKLDSTLNSRTACCAAQMFLDSGDGVVFLGDSGAWYSPESKQFHLSDDAAYKLLSGVLNEYKALDGQPLTEIFLHCRSGISKDEFRGYTAACPIGVKLVAVRVKKEFQGFKLFRDGSYPVLRGSFWKLSETSGYLFASGVVPRLGTYPGTEAPVPLRIDVQHGPTDITQVARDILALTKLNYNACKIGDSEPVTVGFSSAVGEILVSNPTITYRSPKFKFYI
ncbi:MAG: hypothetical protein LAO20_11475 [Acidobacteriia bacterium]|nr:hypothetical protein [Terriglobia bacterium]